jgi:hypothetical protein
MFSNIYRRKVSFIFILIVGPFEYHHWGVAPDIY